MAKTSELNERAQHLLKILVEQYIQGGQPVGSRSLSRNCGLQLSPATIRNVIADLEEYGLVTSPHTSAGRVPTVTGYRMFIDSLLTVKPLKAVEVDNFRRDFEYDNDAIGLVEVASKLLSDVSHMAGVVTLPRHDLNLFRHIEFLSLSNNRVLAILVTNEQEVHNKIIHPSRNFSASELQQASNYINSLFEGEDLTVVRDKVLKEIKETRERMNQGMIDAIEMANITLQSSTNKEDFILSGETNLMEFTELSGMDRLRQLFDAFSQKSDIIHLLDKCLAADGVQIFVGEESGYEVFDNCSLVTSSYSVDEQRVGVLGVIGPTRMEYERLIPLVDITAKLLGAALNQKTSPPS